MKLFCYDTVSSTSDLARELAKEGAPHLTAVLARSQTVGRGRQGRVFLSPEGGTYVSIVLRPRLSPADYGLITPLAAVALHKALFALTGIDTAIKWVNDLLYHGKKVAGILAESGRDATGAPFVILGIGVNTGPVLPSEITDIAATVPFGDPKALATRVTEELSLLLDSLPAVDWLTYYKSHAAMLGSPITVMAGGSVRTATALDVLADGALLVAYENGEREALRGGEITVRPLAPSDGM